MHADRKGLLAAVPKVPEFQDRIALKGRSVRCNSGTVAWFMSRTSFFAPGAKVQKNQVESKVQFKSLTHNTLSCGQGPNLNRPTDGKY